MAAKKIYFKTKIEAQEALFERDPNQMVLSIYKMPKGSRHHGMYAVCSDIEYYNLP